MASVPDVPSAPQTQNSENLQYVLRLQMRLMRRALRKWPRPDEKMRCAATVAPHANAKLGGRCQEFPSGPRRRFVVRAHRDTRHGRRGWVSLSPRWRSAKHIAPHSLR